MIQDQYDPEFYFKVYHVVTKGSSGSPQQVYVQQGKVGGAELYTLFQDMQCGLYTDLSHHLVSLSYLWPNELHVNGHIGVWRSVA